MGVYYPQAVMSLRVLFENFDSKTNPVLNGEYVLSVVPKKLSVNINDYTQADTFSCELDYRNFPFDPRSIRAMGVTIHLMDMGHLVDRFGQIDQLLPPELNDFTKQRLKDSTVFMGFADEESITLDDNSRTISFEGRDFTSLLIDAPYPGKTLDLMRPLTVVLQTMLFELSATRDVFILQKGITGILPSIGSFAPGYTPMAGSRNGGKNESYWDVIQDLVARAGLVCYMELDKLVVSSPRNIFSDENPKQFIYGKNIKSLNIKRKLGKQKGVNLEMRSMNTSKKQVLVAQLPLEGKADWLKRMGLTAKEQTIEKMTAKGKEEVPAPYLVFRVPNIASKDQLITIGQESYEEIFRQEMGGSLETYDMQVCEGSKEESLAGTIINGHAHFDVTKIRMGTPVEILIDNDHLSGIQKINSSGERVKYLKEKGYSALAATALADTIGKYGKAFYTRGVTYDFDAENGFKMKLDFINALDITEKLLSVM